MKLIRKLCCRRFFLPSLNTKAMPDTHFLRTSSMSAKSAKTKRVEEPGNNRDRLKAFLANERATAERINQEFAHPYFDLSKIIEDSEKNYFHLPSNNILFRTAYAGMLHRPAIDMRYILSNVEEVSENLKNRKLPGVNVDVVRDIVKPYEHLLKVKKEKQKCSEKQNELTSRMKEFWMSHKQSKESIEVPEEIENMRREAINKSCEILLLTWIETEIEKEFYEKALLLPNRTHPSVPVGGESEAEIVKTVNQMPSFDLPVVDHVEVGERTGVIHQKYIANFTGQRTYYLCGVAADLEQALVRYTLDKLRERNFELILGPNILHGSMFEACGVAGTKIGDMLYGIDQNQEKDFYIAGTSEVSIAAYLANHSISYKDLPLKLCSISTCNRKETDNRNSPRGLYRVHHFTKVEMFGVTANETGEESQELFSEFVEIQEEILKDLELHFRVVNMPTMELGLPAYKKIDMEVWMAGRETYGEVSSASNCTDFQSRRLHILYKTGDEYKFSHTLNGTACAVPRLILALLENNQTADRKVKLPEVLHPYLKETTLSKAGKRKMEYIGPFQAKNKHKIPV